MQDLTHYLDRLSGQRLLVVGDVMLDRYVWGAAERVSPEAPVLVLREDQDEVRPGGAANVASFLRALEAEVVLAGVVGDDAEGQILRRIMDDLAADSSAVLTDAERPTTTKQRLVGRTAQRQPHQILRIDRESRVPLGVNLQQQLIERLLATIPSCDAVLVSDYGKGVCSPNLLRAVIDHAKDQKIPVLIDPARGGDYERYCHATLLTPNRAAAEIFLGKSLRDPEEIRNAARQVRERLQLDVAVLTVDQDGLAYATVTETGLVPCRPREVCDVTGAGDMVLAVLGLCQAAQISLVDSLHLANAAAGLEVERFGVEPVSRVDIARELARGHRDSSMPITLDHLLVQVQAYRRAGRSIVFTNGCFDLLHVGHVTLLEEAARLGDILIVAINGDASVRKLKGLARPMIGQDDRARMLCALSCVDHVVIFEDDTPHFLLRAIQPDVLVKGGTTDHIVGREIVEAYGGCSAHTATVAGLSTTLLIQRMEIQQIAETNG